MSWKRIIDEKPSDDYRDRVLRAAHQTNGEREGFSMWRRWIVSGGVIAAVLTILYRQRRMTENETAGSFPLLGETEMLENMELVERLDLFDDLDVLIDEKVKTNG